MEWVTISLTSGSYGNFTYSYNLLFLLSLCLSVFVVFVFSLSKFDEPSFERKGDDYITQLLPKELATKKEFSHALILYISTLIAILVVLSLLGPSALMSLGFTKVPDAPAALPFFLALIIVGLLPNVPVIRDLERQFRGFAHERAFIPLAARTTADMLAAAEFDFSAYANPLAKNSTWLRGVESSDLTSARGGTLEYSWARLSCLLYEVNHRQDTDQIGDYEASLIKKYEIDLENIGLKKRALESDVAQYRHIKSTNLSHSDDDLHQTIRKTLRKLYVLLGCAVRLKIKPPADLNSTFARFGFVFDVPSMGPPNTDLIIAGLAVMTVCVFVVAFVATGLPGLFSWHVSTLFPTNGFDPFILAVSTLIAHGTAIFVADRMRSRLLEKRRWFRSGERRNPANYVYAALLCGFAGYVILLLWAMIFEDPSLLLAAKTSPLGLLPAATGAFYVFHLDNVDLKQNPPQWLEIGAQGAVTGFCAYVATTAWLSLLKNKEPSTDYLLLMSLIGICIGISLGWYIPKAARNRYDPRLEAQEAWTNALQRYAEKVFPTAKEMTAWLETPHPDFNGQSPKTAIVDRQSFELALDALQKIGSRANTLKGNTAATFVGMATGAMGSPLD